MQDLLWDKHAFVLGRVYQDNKYQVIVNENLNLKFCFDIATDRKVIELHLSFISYTKQNEIKWNTYVFLSNHGLVLKTYTKHFMLN